MKKVKYQSGGPVSPVYSSPATLTSPLSSLYVTPRPLQDVRQQAVDYYMMWDNIFHKPTDTTITPGLKLPTGTSRKVKSKDRFYERANGGEISPEVQGVLGAIQGIGPMLGPWGMAAAGAASLAPTVAKLFARPDNTVVSGSPGSYNMGGDVPLSSSAFQVKGDPSVVDSEEYVIGQRPVKLDHNEVYKQGENGYVFSNRLKTPDNQRFSDLAKSQELAIKKAEKKVARNPYDQISLKTIDRSNANLANLAGIQELVATAKGLREPMADVSTGAVPGMWSGGPGDPPVLPYRLTRAPKPNSPLWNDPTYATPEKMAALRNVVMQTALPPSGGGPYAPVMNTPADVLGNQYGVAEPSTTSAVPGQSANPVELVPQRANLSTVGNDELMDNYRNNPADPTLRAEVMARGLLPKPTPGGRGGAKRKTTAAPPTKATGVPGEFMSDDLRVFLPYDTEPLPSERTNTPLAPLLNRTVTSNATRPAPNFLPTYTQDSQNYVPTESGAQETDSTATTSGSSKFLKNFTVGDALQGASTLAKFASLIGGPEKEKAYSNASPISQAVYDPTNALYQNQRAYSNTLNRLTTIPSINTSRAIANSLYANNLNQQNNILSQYERMNMDAKQQYQDRLAARRAENIKYSTYTDDLNARNRAAYQASVQDAFGSLTNLGIALNQKQQQQQSLDILRETYKDVFARYDKALNG